MFSMLRILGWRLVLRIFIYNCLLNWKQHFKRMWILSVWRRNYFWAKLSIIFSNKQWKIIWFLIILKELSMRLLKICTFLGNLAYFPIFLTIWEGKKYNLKFWESFTKNMELVLWGLKKSNRKNNNLWILQFNLNRNKINNALKFLKRKLIA